MKLVCIGIAASVILAGCAPRHPETLRASFAEPGVSVFREACEQRPDSIITLAQDWDWIHGRMMERWVDGETVRARLYRYRFERGVGWQDEYSVQSAAADAQFERIRLRVRAAAAHSTTSRPTFDHGIGGGGGYVVATDGRLFEAGHLGVLDYIDSAAIAHNDVDEDQGGDPELRSYAVDLSWSAAWAIRDEEDSVILMIELFDRAMRTADAHGKPSGW